MVKESLYIIGILTSLGCASYIDLGGGRYLKTESTQDPVMWGVSNSHSVAYDCKGTQREGYNYEKLDFSDCHQATEIKHASAPGYGTAIANAVISGLTLGFAAHFFDGGGGDASASASSSSSSSAVSSSTVINKGSKGH